MGLFVNRARAPPPEQNSGDATANARANYLALRRDDEPLTIGIVWIAPGVIPR